MRIAIPITASTMDEALEDIDKAAEVADIIELRIDYMQNPDLERLLAHSSLPKIVTNRTQYEGGKFQGSEEKRIAYLQEAISLGVEYVDIELNHFRPLDKKSTRLIVSYHNFEQTPEDLDEIYKRIVNKGADIVKIATKAQNYEDNLRMLNLIANSDRDTIGICMGKEGIITRVLGPVYGGYLTFASLGEGKSSAPGQLTADELREAWRFLQLD